MLCLVLVLVVVLVLLVVVLLVVLVVVLLSEDVVVVMVVVPLVVVLLVVLVVVLRSEDVVVVVLVVVLAPSQNMLVGWLVGDQRAHQTRQFDRLEVCRCKDRPLCKSGTTSRFECRRQLRQSIEQQLHTVQSQCLVFRGRRYQMPRCNTYRIVSWC